MCGFFLNEIISLPPLPTLVLSLYPFLWRLCSSSFQVLFRGKYFTCNCSFVVSMGGSEWDLLMPPFRTFHLILLSHLTFSFFNSLIYFWLHCVFTAVHGLSLVNGERGILSGCSAQAAHCSDFSCCDWQALGVLAHRLSCPATCGISPEQGSNPCPLHWRVDS